MRRAKIDRDEVQLVDRVLRLLGDAWPQHALAKLYGVYQQTISRALDDGYRSHQREQKALWLRKPCVREKLCAYKAAKAEQINTQRRAWRKANPAKVRAQHHKRRAALYAAPGLGIDLVFACEAWGWLCAYCRRDPPGKVHIDHVIPLARGGTNEPENLVPTCERCNLAKGARDLADFAPARAVIVPLRTFWIAAAFRRLRL